MRVILFNLYPYRNHRESKRRRRVIAELSAGLLVGLFFCYAVGSEFSQRVANKENFLSNLSAMEAEMATQAAEVQIKKDRVAELSRQVGALEAVEKESLLASQWLSFLDRTVPNGVSLTRLSAKMDAMFIGGFTSSVSELAAWVDQMESGNALFQSVDLVTLVEAQPNAGSGTTAITANNTAGQEVHQFEIKALLRGGQDAPR